MYKYIYLIGLLLGASVVAAPEQNWFSQVQENFTTEVLPNGLTVVVYPMPGQYQVRVGVTYDVGSKDELPHEYGLAHMVEHMIFKGTEKMSESDLNALADKFCIGKIGVGFNAFTSRDITHYYFNTDKDNYGVFLDVLADCMFNVRFDEQHFTSEVKAVIEEINLGRQNVGKIIYDSLSSMLYPFGHPYHHKTLGYKEQLLNHTSDNLKAFYQRNYHPSRAVLTIIGDVNSEQAFTLARAKFTAEMSLPERIEQKERPIRTDQLSSNKQVLYKAIPHPVTVYGWRVPTGPVLEVAGDCFAQILGQRLRRTVVHERDLAIAVQATYLPERLGSFFYIQFYHKEGRSVKEVKTLIQQEFERLSKNGPTESELACYKRSTKAQLLKAFETIEGIDFVVALGSLFKADSLDKAFKELELLEDLTAQQVTSFAQEQLRPRIKATITCLPIPQDEQGNWQERKQQEDAYEQELLAQKMRQAEVEAPRYTHTLADPVLPEFAAPKPDLLFTLSNGLKVCVKQRQISPFIRGQLCFDDNELLAITLQQKSKPGVDDLAKMGLADGTASLNKEQLREFAELRSSNYYFEQGYLFNCPAEHLCEIARTFFEVIAKPAYPNKLLSQRIKSFAQVMEAGKQTPMYAVQLLKDYLYGEYTWTKSYADTVKAFTTVTRKEVVAFHDTYLRPDRMSLVLVGPVNLATIKQELEQAVSTWRKPAKKASALLTKEALPEVVNPAAHEITQYIAADQVVLAMGRLSCKAGTKDMAALSLIQSYLDTKMFEIRECSGLFYGYGAGLIGNEMLTDNFLMIALPVSVAHYLLAEQAVKALLTDIATNGIPQEVINKAKELARIDRVKFYADTTNLCAGYAAILARGLDWDAAEKRLVTIEALTKQEVDVVAAKYLDPTTWTTIIAGRVGEPPTPQEPEPKKKSSGFFSWFWSK